MHFCTLAEQRKKLYRHKASTVASTRRQVASGDLCISLQYIYIVQCNTEEGHGVKSTKRLPRSRKGATMSHVPYAGATAAGHLASDLRAAVLRGV